MSYMIDIMYDLYDGPTGKKGDDSWQAELAKFAFVGVDPICNIIIQALAAHTTIP